MRTADFDFALPPELIAQHPAARRDESRLLVVHRGSEAIEHRQFCNLPDYFRGGDLLVLNDSRVIPARLHALRTNSTGLAAEGQPLRAFEILLLEQNSRNDWWAMMRPGKRARLGGEFVLVDRAGAATGIGATVTGINAQGHRRLTFISESDILDVVDTIGEIPLPPYIRRELSKDAASLEEHETDRARYQTVYACEKGSVAAPTAGLHFTNELLQDLRARGVEIERVTLHVGFGTFAGVKTDQIEEHVMHHESFDVSAQAATAINRAKAEGRRVIAVGTTTVRVLESMARAHGGRAVAGRGRTNIFIYPPAEFGIVDGLVTNFHLPESTLLMLVSAFATPGRADGRDLLMRAYAEAIRARYRFFSYGDAMLIL